MTIQLQLTREEAILLAKHLDNHLRRLDAELVHTDNREFHQALAREIAMLQAVAERLEDSAPSLRRPPTPAEVAR